MENQNEKQPGASNSGNVVGVPGPNVENVGLLDLRGCSPEELAKLKSLRNIGTVLMDSGGRTALSDVVSENVGAFVEADADARVLMGPMIELDRLTLESMDDNQKLVIVGILWVADDVTPELIQSKLGKVHLTGILLAPKTVRGALVARIEHTGVVAALPAGMSSVIKEIGQKTITPGYLSFVKNDNLYVNIGQTIFGSDVTLAQVQEKIASYVNVGQTIASQDIIDYLSARCEANLGQFALPEADKAG